MRIPVLLLMIAGMTAAHAFDLFRGRRDTLRDRAGITAAQSSDNMTNTPPVVVYASLTGSDANTGTNASAPLKTLQNAVTAARIYGSIAVRCAKGQYTPGNGLNSGMDGLYLTNTAAGITLTGGWENDFSLRYASNHSILDGGLAGYRVVTVSNAHGVALNGFTVKNGSNADGGGIAVIATVHFMLTNCSVVSNHAGNGGGIFISNASNVHIASSRFISNSAGNKGAAVHASYARDVRIAETHLSRNYSVTHAGGISLSRCTNALVTNCAILTNYAGAGSAAFIDYGSNTVFSSVSVLSNSGAQVFYLNIPAAFSLVNSAVTNNNMTHCSVLLFNASPLIISNNIFGGVAGTLYGLQELGAQAGHLLYDNRFITGTMDYLYYDTILTNTPFTVDAGGIANINSAAMTGAASAGGNALY
ncbi:MAG: right-handed parallel beta-helix repeat-containing protein [Spirochaetes bacterium]|nr:right-handed parallel beta-helix repeat-containing protein [Spirochaetota bacterium]